MNSFNRFDPSPAMMSLEWSENPFLYWGVGGGLAASLSFFLSMLVLEAIILLKVFPMIEYVGKNNRGTNSDEIRRKFSFAHQFFSATYTLAGPTMIVNSFILTVIMMFATDGNKPSLPTTIVGGCFQVTAMKVLDDFFVYWGHRLLHTEYLWKYHRIHHQLTTPSPVSTAYLDNVDATIQAGIPQILSFVIVCPHPIIMYIFIASRVLENVFNHSGLDSTVLNCIFLRVLPFRASAGHHDIHHRFCNNAKGAKNFGEAFWLWDWLFGTLISSTTAAMRNTDTEKSVS